MSLHGFDRALLPATPWKNGGGVTREIVCQPPGAGMADFDWRVSIADISSDGPFSIFPGVDRVITLLEGAGVHLHSSDGALDHVLNTALQPFAFAGETPVLGHLLDGTSQDFNVMTRRAACRAEMQLCQGASTVRASAGLLLAVRGHWHVAAHRLKPSQGLWWNASAQTLDLRCDDANAALLSVQIERVAP
ncbi:MAG: HutD family protein [Pseudomonadota bacterium]|jgi:hypothetical protein